MKSLIFVFLLALSARADSIYLPNLPGYASGTASGGKNSLDVTLVGGAVVGAVNQGTPGPLASPWPVEGSDGTNHASYTAGNAENVNITNSLSVASDGPTGASVPAQASYLGGNKAGNLTGLLIGQQTMANSLACVLPSDQSAIPVSESGTWNINNISGTITLPTGAATAVKQPALGTAGSASADVITVQGIASMTPLLVNGSGSTQPVSGTVAVTQSTSPWVNNISQINGVVPLMGNGITGTGSQRVTIASDNTAFSVNAIQSGTWTVQPGNTANTTAWLVTGTGGTFPATQSGAWTVQNKGSLNATPSFSSASISGATTVSAPSNVVEEKVCALDSNTANLRVAFGETASSSNGVQLQPGRCEDFHVNANASICPESGTQGYMIQWSSQ